ncbi:hypothetical protein RirG_247450 [Rhizophagus irregularis DAOM 197198w]|uniref:Uncharacterized protein n=1 Tax=Rhizophagus irregularis (strain DAOM 197198w) TaxID=1432141 RepID=A0A015JDN2_RHIIW|nr:hypothetical protein RirG_247450 [Rhizophagus irregularis DAOM 197198w]
MKGDGFPKEYFKIRSGGLPKNGKPKDLIGWASVFRRTGNSKIRSGGLPKKGKPRNQGSGGLPKKGKPRNQGSGGLPKKGKPRNQDSSRVSRVSSEKQKKPKICKFGWIAKEQSKIHIYEYMNHVIVELYLN